MQENPETIPEVTENPENPEIPKIPESSEKLEPVSQDPSEPAPKRRGRPEGARDRAPRKKKNIVIVEEEPPPAPEPAPPVQTPVQETTAEDSPRTLIRNASEHILKLKNVTKMARKAHLQESYTKPLRSLS